MDNYSNYQIYDNYQEDDIIEEEMNAMYDYYHSEYEHELDLIDLHIFEDSEEVVA